MLGCPVGRDWRCRTDPKSRTREQRRPARLVAILKEHEKLMTIPIRTIDHIVVMTKDMERAIAFYCDVLGGTPRFLQQFRDGKFPVLPVELGGAIVNLQYLDQPAYIVATRLESGTVDVCFRWDGSIAEAEAYLTAAGVEIIEGPVPRPAADGVWGLSVYFRDPDGNLLEFLTTAEPSEPLVFE